MTGVSRLGSIVRCRSAEIRLVAGVLFAVLVCLLLLAPPSFAGWPLMGGPTWYWQNPTPQGNTMSGVSFTSAAKGWAAGYGGRILVTKDGASTWAFQDSGVKDDLYDVSFVSDAKGWMVGDNGTVICTTNGGRSGPGRTRVSTMRSTQSAS